MNARDRLNEKSLCKTCQHCFAAITQSKHEDNQPEWEDDGVMVYCLKNQNYARLGYSDVASLPEGEKPWEYITVACSQYESSLYKQKRPTQFMVPYAEQWDQIHFCPDPAPKVKRDGCRGSTITLSTGRTFHCNKGIIGIDPEGSVWEGYDGELVHNNPEERPHDQPLTDAEKRELALYAIGLWRNFGGLP